MLKYLSIITSAFIGSRLVVYGINKQILTPEIGLLAIVAFGIFLGVVHAFAFSNNKPNDK